MFKTPIAPFLAVPLLASPAHSNEQVAIVRAEGLLVFIPEIGGPDTYGTYLLPNALGRDSLDRFYYVGNPETVSRARKMVDELLGSHELVRRPLNSDELAKRSVFKQSID